MYNKGMMKYIIAGCTLGIILGSLPIGLGASLSVYFWKELNK